MEIGIFKTSLLENENRLPIYPEHIPWIDNNLLKQMVFEEGYGLEYGYDDSYFEKQDSVVATREELFEMCDLLVLPKPTALDLKQMKSYQTLWGWAHCVQQKEITQIAIEKELTLITWESMFHWGETGQQLTHIFYKNNEIAGYASVLHVLELLGMDGRYGPRKRVAIVGYGSAGRGAIYALQGRGFNNIHVYTKRLAHLVSDQNPDVYFHNLHPDQNNDLYVSGLEQSNRPFIEDLAKTDLICNCTLQDTDNPIMFLNDKDETALKPHTVIVDISCDKEMGFPFATPTSFEKPILKLKNNVNYYAVDHTPTYLWNSASREISKAIIPYLKTITKGPNGWNSDPTIANAIEINCGKILNKKIINFQNRQPIHPHCYLQSKQQPSYPSNY